jgi:hypothetical protein
MPQVAGESGLKRHGLCGRIALGKELEVWNVTAAEPS